MSKIIVYIAVSLDGYIARPDGSVKWLDKYFSEDYGYHEFTESIDCVFLGSSTYEKSLSFGKDVFKDRKHYVFSRRKGRQNHDTVEFIAEDIKHFVSNIKSASNKDIWLMGGGLLIRSFLESDLIDEFIIFVMPELIGSGIALFPGYDAGLILERRGYEAYQNGVMKLHYARASK